VIRKEAGPLYITSSTLIQIDVLTAPVCCPEISKPPGRGNTFVAFSEFCLLLKKDWTEERAAECRGH